MQEQGRKNRDHYANALESVHQYLIRVLKITREHRAKSKTIFSTHNHNINNIVLLFFPTIIIDNQQIMSKINNKK